MAFEVIRGEDARIVLSHKKQSAYLTRIVDGDFSAGKSPRLTSMILGDVSPVRAGEGARAMQGHEWSDGSLETVILLESSLRGLSCEADSFMAGWVAAFFFGQVTSVQEAATTHYTHTFRPVSPLAATGRTPPVTSVYIDTNGPDATRLRRVVQDLAIEQFSLSWRTGAMAMLAADFIGSGKEVVNPTITIPALMTQIPIPCTAMKLEYGTKGGALTDIIERCSEGSISFSQSLASADGYHPGSGQFRGRIWFNRRTFSISFSIFVNRANRDLIDDMLANTRKEVKITFDSGVVAGTGTANHKIVARYPDVRITSAPIVDGADGAMYNISISEEQIYRDTSVADTPVTITIDGVQTSFLT